VLDRTAFSPPPGFAAQAPPRPNRLGLFGMVPRSALRRLGGDAGAVHLYALLAVAAAEQGRSSPAHGQACVAAIRQLAADLGCTARTVQRRLGVLVSAGLLSAHGRADSRGRTLTTEYVFRYPAADGPLRPPPDVESHGHPGRTDTADTPDRRAGGATRETAGATPGDTGDAMRDTGDEIPTPERDDAGVTPKDQEESEKESIDSAERARDWLRRRRVFRAPAASGTTMASAPSGLGHPGGLQRRLRRLGASGPVAHQPRQLLRLPPGRLQLLQQHQHTRRSVSGRCWRSVRGVRPLLVVRGLNVRRRGRRTPPLRPGGPLRRQENDVGPAAGPVARLAPAPDALAQRVRLLAEQGRRLGQRQDARPRRSRAGEGAAGPAVRGVRVHGESTADGHAGPRRTPYGNAPQAEPWPEGRPWYKARNIPG
jgi:hypothetical protein